MKKRLPVLLAALLLAIFFAGCGNTASSQTLQSNSQAGTSDDGNVGVIWDAVSCEDASGIFEATQITMKAPEGATDIAYTVIGGNLGEIKFSYNGIAYCYRASETADGVALHGVYGELSVAAATHTAGGSAVTINFGPDGCKLADWSENGVNYSLYSADGVKADISTVIGLITK